MSIDIVVHPQPPYGDRDKYYPSSAAIAEGLGACELTCLMLRRSWLDLSDNDITSLASATFVGEIQ